MLRRGGISLAGVLVLAVLLGSPVAADPGPHRTASGGPTLGSLWSWVVRQAGIALDPWSPATAAACDDGASIDPNGGCRQGQAAHPDQGPMIDPDG